MREVLFALLCATAVGWYGTAATIQLALILPVVCVFAVLLVQTSYRVTMRWYVLSLALMAICALVVAVQALVPAPDGMAAFGPDRLALFDIVRQVPLAVDQEGLFVKIGVLLLTGTAFLVGLSIGDDYDRTLRLLAVSVLACSALVALTLFIFWIRPDLVLLQPRTSYFGYYTHSFINRNTAASFLGCMAIAALALTGRQLRRAGSWRDLLRGTVEGGFMCAVVLRVGPFALAFALFLMGLFATGSRGGIAASMVALGVFVLAYVVKRRRVIAGLIFVAVNVAVVAALLFRNENILVTRFSDVRSITEVDRFRIFQSTFAMIADHPWFGVGLGGFSSTFPQYRLDAFSPNNIIDRAHSTPLELAAEMGIPFAVLCAAFWFTIGRALLRGVVTRTHGYIVSAMGLSIWVLMTIHMLFDFSLQIPGFALIYFAFLGAALSQSTLRGGTEPRRAAVDPFFS